MTRQLLKGIRVLDFTDFLAGPYCGMYLADMGADVIKVENLTTGGNFVRNARPLEKNSGLSMYFQNLNRNKRGVAINLKTEDGKKLFSELVKSADVLLENNRPGVMGRLGFSYEECKKLNPRLVYASISGFGQYGPNANRPGYDLIGQAKVVSEGVQSGGNVNVIPGDCTSTGGYKVTITRGDAYVAPTKTITEIIVTGLTPPVKGATPVDKSKVTLTDGLTVESITWGPALTSDGKFAANTAYTAHINYSVKAGYELAANANCPQVAGANVTRWHQEGMPQDEIEVTFPKTAADTPTEKAYHHS